MKLAGRMGVTKQSAGELVDQLKRSGYVVLSVDPTDGRARLVILSDTGLTLSRTPAMASAEVEHKWRKHLGEKAFNQMWEGARRAKGNHRSLRPSSDYHGAPDVTEMLMRAYVNAYQGPSRGRRRATERAK